MYSGVCFLKKKQFEEKYNIKTSTVESLVNRIRDEQGRRYPIGSVTNCGRIIRVREDVFADMMTYGNAIEAGIAPAFGRMET